MKDREIKLEDVFNDEKRQGVKELIDTHKQRPEKYSERFDNDESAIGNFETWGRRLVEDKQETLEEAAKRLYPLRNTFLERFKDLEQKIFINGAKWQQEQIGKSEFLQKLRATLSDAEARRLIFETFKNK